MRNMVIREALQLSERPAAFDDERMDDEPDETEEQYIDAPPVLPKASSVYEKAERYRRAKRVLYDEAADIDEKRNAVAALEKLWDEGYAIAARRLGRVYLTGEQTAKDVDTALSYLTRSAAQGNIYAQYFLDHRNNWQHASTGTAVLRMLHHMSRIFADNAVTDSTYMGLQIDRKRRQEMRDKRIALGHKADDREDHVQQQTV